LIIDAAAELRPRADFVPAQEHKNTQVTDPWTLGDALWVAAGCKRKTAAFPCWEHREITAPVSRAWELLASKTDGVDPHIWANQTGRTLPEVLAVLDSAGAEGDVDAYPTMTLRPWCHLNMVSTCRIPYVPLAAVVHAYKLRSGSLTDLLAEFEIDAKTDPWTILDRIEPTIVETDSPDGVREMADTLRLMMHANPPIFTPSRVLVMVAEGEPTTGLHNIDEHWRAIATAADAKADADADADDAWLIDGSEREAHLASAPTAAS